MKKAYAIGVMGVSLVLSCLGLVGCGDGGEESEGETCERSNIECSAAAGASDAVCVNDTDCGDVESGDYRATAKDCLLNECTEAADQAQCVADCLVSTNGVTAECSACYGASAACSSDNCFAECASDGDSCECVTCQEENGCTQDFFDCSGLAVPE